MVTVDDVREYLNLPPDAGDKIIKWFLASAKSKARAAGIPNFQNNAQYDIFLCSLSGFLYDNRNLGFIGSGNRGTSNAEANMRALVNAFVLELRYATEDDGGTPPPWSTPGVTP